MDVLTFTKTVFEAIQKIQPGLDSAAKVATSLTTIGTTVVQLLKHGRRLYTYFVGQRADAGQGDVVEIVQKEDVVILIDINRRMLADVTTYMQTQKIDANLFIVTNDPLYSEQIQFLDASNPQEWEELVREFNEVIGIIKRYVGNARMHFFLSTPLPLAFALGSVWGTVDEATVYHWQNNSYHPVMPISRRLRSG